MSTTGTHNDTKSEANSANGLHIAEVSMKLYFIPIISFSGVLLNLWTLIVYNWRWPFGEQRIYKTVSAIGNISVLFFRSIVNFWLGDGLYYSTNGAAYVYLDQISDTWCSVLRSIGGVSEVVPITLTSMEVFAFRFHLLTRRSSKTCTLSLFATYFTVTAAVSFTTYYLSTSIQPSSSSPIGHSCLTSYDITLFQVLLLVTQTLAYAMPALAMLCLGFEILVRCFTRKKVENLSDEEAKENPIPVLILAATYSVSLLLLFLCTLVRIVQNIQTGTNTDILSDLNNVIIMLAFVLPIVDFACLCAFRPEFCHGSANKVHALE